MIAAAIGGLLSGRMAGNSHTPIAAATPACSGEAERPAERVGYGLRRSAGTLGAAARPSRGWRGGAGPPPRRLSHARGPRQQSIQPYALYVCEVRIFAGQSEDQTS